MHRASLALSLTFALAGVVAPVPATEPDAGRDYRALVAAMKTAERGPFARIRWFCKDGAVLPPEPHACKDHGGGRQHGEWTDAVKHLRGEGYLIANVYAAIDAAEFAAAEEAPDALAQMLIEQFLINVDDGWILRRARYYRGALQEEGERAGARRLLFRLAERREWLERRYPLLRTAAGLLRHGQDTHTAAQVRQRAADLAARDPGFAALRNKIHVHPELADAASVRRYAATAADAGLAAELEALATTIEEVYSGHGVLEALAALAAELDDVPALRREVEEGAARLRGAHEPAARLRATAALLVTLRDGLTRPNGPRARVAMLDASHAVENEHYVAGRMLRDRIEEASRRELLELAAVGADAAYGAGLISARQRGALAETIDELRAGELDVGRYRRAVDYLALVPAWATQTLRLHFSIAVQRFLELDPLAALFIQDRLRGSAVFFYAELLELLSRDARRLAGVSNELFGEDVGGALRALNPGLARGTLHVLPPQGADARFEADGIYLLPETVADLPPIAGILTAGEGNPLSHVQLLARNLGIPNVAVDLGLHAELERHAGETVVLAVSPLGSVRLMRDDGSLDHLFAEVADERALIRPDLEKLDLTRRAPIDLEDLRAGDSGRIVGPKAAKLGELKHHFPEAVADGIAVPFGAFRALLDRPAAGGASMFEWMVGEYRALEALPAGSALRREAAERLRAQLEAWIVSQPLPADLEAALRTRLAARFGADGSYGVFVRSDTNVEDLPSFTGAGLNLTVPNVVGVDAILTAIPRVWASPFSARAFAWRQSLMLQPEHVYPAVLLLESVPVEKSGVLVTRDVDTGDAGWLSVAVNEGVGGAVDGQAAESLRIETATGRVRLLAQASAPRRRVLDPAGGIREIPASGADTVLEPAEIAQLVELARELPARFPPIVDDHGEAAPADIEFGFLDGRLMLFQIRPFLESQIARSSAYLASLDAASEGTARVPVDLDAPPGARLAVARGPGS